MAIHRISQFDVANISTDVTFVLDTNILYYVHSGYHSLNSVETREYSNLILSILNNNNKICVSSLTLQELFYIIENKEYNLHINSTSNSSCTKKNFRRNANLRSQVKQKIKHVFSELQGFYTFCDITVLNSYNIDFMNTFTNHHYDPVDYAMVKSLHSQKIIFISHDKDFQSDAGIELVTL